MPRKFNQQQVRKRTEEIIAAALRLAEAPGGWVKLTATLIATEAGCSYGLVALYLGSMDDLRQTLVKVSMKQENYAVLAQVMLTGNYKIPATIRAKVIAHISGE